MATEHFFSCKVFRITGKLKNNLVVNGNLYNFVCKNKLNKNRNKFKHRKLVNFIYIY